MAYNAKSRYLEQALLSAVFKGVTFPTFSSGVYVALMTASPSDTGGGAEVTGGAYVRQHVLSSVWGAFTNPDPTGTRLPNATAVTWPAPSGSWGTIVGVAIYDAATGGNLLYYGLLDTPVSKDVGSPAFTFDIGQLFIFED